MSTSNQLKFDELIKAWADGATVQFRPVQISPNSPSLLKEWKDLPVVSECGRVAPMFNTRRFEYRIKPEDTSRPWRPKEGESFWLVGYDGDIYQSDALPNLNRKVIDIGNCFPASIKGHEEAEAAAERFKAILKDESLKLKNSEPNRTNFQLDGKPLTHIEKNAIRMFRAGVPFPEAECGTWRALSPGEDALIKALRAVKIADVYPYDAVIVYKDGDGELITDSYLVAFSLAITEGGRSALSESLNATCTALNKIQKEQEEAK